MNGKEISMLKRFDFRKKTFPKWFFPFISFSLAAALRIYGLGIVPGGYQMDEAYSAWTAFSLYHTGIDSAGYSFPVYFEAWGHGMNALNSYLMLPFIALFGGQVNLLTVRMPQLLVSLASLVALYALMQKIFSASVANWALFLAAICPWHVMMSRWGLESNLAPGFLMIGLCFFVYGIGSPKLLLLSSVSYGLSLYCYATIWPIVPLMLFLQIIYCLGTKALRFTKWLSASALVLGLMAFPLVCFLLVNMGYLPGFSIGPFSVYKMTMFRGNELASSVSDLASNLRNLLYLFYHQDVGRPYDVIMPYGFFYNIGRFFIIIGIVLVIIQVIRSLFQKKFSYYFLLFAQLLGAGVVGLLLSVNMTQINCSYLPLVLCEALGVTALLSFVGKYKKRLQNAAGLLITAVYLVCLTGFQYHYYTDYRELSSAYFQQGTDEAVKSAFEIAQARHLDIYVNDGLKYPNVLLSAEITAKEYLDTVVYSERLPAPNLFSKNGVTFHMGYSMDDLSEQGIYLIYETDVDAFKAFDLTQYCDWYVAVPRE